MLSADLHIHSCLSPCGDLDMGPEAVIEKLKQHNISIFAIADHNSTRNCRAFVEVASRNGLRCIPAIEVTSSEEVHILCYFDSVDVAETFGALIEESLLQIAHDEDATGGMQVVVNGDEEVIDMVENYLSVSSSYCVSEVVDLAHEHGGVVVPAHVDKPVYSLTSQLGFITDDPFDALELSYGCLKRGDGDLFDYKGVISGSDAHYPDDIGRVSFSTDCSIDSPVAEVIGSVTKLNLQ